MIQAAVPVMLMQGIGNTNKKLSESMILSNIFIYLAIFTSIIILPMNDGNKFELYRLFSYKLIGLYSYYYHIFYYNAESIKYKF